MAKRLWMGAISVLAALILLAGCQSGGGGGGSNGDEGSGGSDNVSFDFSMPYHLAGLGGGGGGLLNGVFSADDVFVGTLLAHNSDTGVDQTFDWSIYLDEDTLDLQSNKTIILDPGTYDFSLLVSQGDHQYAGEALGVAIADGENTIPLVVRPVIGDVTTDVEVVARLVDLRFNYDPAEFAGAGIGSPQIGISVGGGTEAIFDVNPATGLSEYMLLNLVPGPYHIELRLLNAGMQRGKSVDAQEDATLSPGVDVTMDLVRLHGEVVLSLDEETGEATFLFNIPEEIVDEAGGVGDLQALMQIARSESPAQAVDEQVLSLSGPVGGNYQASVYFPSNVGFQFEAIWISLTFTDITDDYLLGSCTNAVMLNTSAQTGLCELTLVRRADITGNLLATLGINVFTEGWEPVAGAPVYANGDFVGITGSGGFGTAGYIKAYLLAGDYTIRAEDGGMSGESEVSLDPLDIDNVDVILNQSALSDVLLIGQFTPDVPQAYLAPYFNSVDVFINLSGTPSLAQLLMYKSVGVWGNGCMLDTVAMGNVLADYVDAGGGVVLTTWTHLAPGCIGIQGRFEAEQYSPHVGSSGNTHGWVSMATVHEPGHPIMAGVSVLDSYYKENFPSGMAPGALLLASYNNGDPVAAVGANPRVAHINFHPEIAIPTRLTGDYARLLANALNFVAGN